MFRTIILAALVAACLVSTAAAESLDNVLAKYYEAIGGLDKLNAVQGLTYSGHIVLGQGQEAPITLYKKRNGAMHLEFNFMGISGSQTYDGTHGWAVMPFQTGKKDPELMSGDDVKEAARMAEWGGPLVDYKAKGHKLELIGKQKIEGTDAWKIKVTRNDGTVQYVYLDADSYLEIKSEGKVTRNGTETEYESYNGDYKQVAGLTMPFMIENGTKGASERQKIVIDKIEVNGAMADSMFALPTSLASAATASDSTAASANGTTGKSLETKTVQGSGGAPSTETTPPSPPAKKPAPKSSKKPESKTSN